LAREWFPTSAAHWTLSCCHLERVSAANKEESLISKAATMKLLPEELWAQPASQRFGESVEESMSDLYHHHHHNRGYTPSSSSSSSASSLSSPIFGGSSSSSSSTWMPSRLNPTSFGDSSALASNNNAKMCGAEGQMIWTKDKDGVSHHSVCYAPSMIGEQWGPAGSSKRCDDGTYFMLQLPRYCCKHPRLHAHGHRYEAANPVCGDLAAEFDPETQKVRVIGGPESTGTPQDFEAVANAGLGKFSLSPLAFHARSTGSRWMDSSKTTCTGAEGVLVKWRGDSQRAELCNPGSPPVRGNGYSSWACEGSYTEERRFHCCRIDGQMDCVPDFSDETARSGCDCDGVGGPRDEYEKGHESIEDTVAAAKAAASTAGDGSNAATMSSADAATVPLVAIALNLQSLRAGKRPTKRCDSGRSFL